MFTQVDHVGIAVNDLDAATALYQAAFGVDIWERMVMPERHMQIAVAQIGDTRIELIAPTSPEAVFAKYLAERGPGMHHIAYRVDDIAGALDRLRQAGVRLIDETPRPGMHGSLTAFVHPKAVMGVLVELVQVPEVRSQESGVES
jgi:methylmalonyl-CoA/ethylmalonyl-CoA epimerase